MSAGHGHGTTGRIKKVRTFLTRQRWFYRLVFRLRALSYAAGESLSIAASRLSGRRILVGIDIVSTAEPSGGFKYELAGCVRFKNEGRFLAEWIEFHRLVGFEHFYLYNNNSTDEFHEVLEPYISEGIVTLHDWPRVPASPAADIHCIDTHRLEAKWIAFLDADEFLFAADGTDLRKVLRDFLAYPAVAVNWVYFGINGHERRPEGLVVENYTRRAAAANRHVKSIVNPRKAIRHGNSHHWFYTGGRLAVHATGRPVYGSFHEPASVGRLQINHYFSKSAEDFLAKAKMKTFVDKEGTIVSGRRESALEHAITAHNDIEDTTAYRIAAKIPDAVRHPLTGCDLQQFATR